MMAAAAAEAARDADDAASHRAGGQPGHTRMHATAAVRWRWCAVADTAAATATAHCRPRAHHLRQPPWYPGLQPGGGAAVDVEAV